VAYDEDLADRVWAVLAAEAVTERQLFGRLAFLLGGHMFCGRVKDTLMVRLGPDGAERTLDWPHVRPMDFTGRADERHGLRRARRPARPGAPGMGRRDLGIRSHVAAQASQQNGELRGTRRAHRCGCGRYRAADGPYFAGSVVTKARACCIQAARSWSLALPPGAISTQPGLGPRPISNGRAAGLASAAPAASAPTADQQGRTQDPAAHVPADQERQPAEHLLLGRLLPGRGQDRPHPLSQLLIEGHAPLPSSRDGGLPLPVRSQPTRVAPPTRR